MMDLQVRMAALCGSREGVKQMQIETKSQGMPWLKTPQNTSKRERFKIMNGAPGVILSRTHVHNRHRGTKAAVC